MRTKTTFSPNAMTKNFGPLVAIVLFVSAANCQQSNKGTSPKSATGTAPANATTTAQPKAQQSPAEKTVVLAGKVESLSMDTGSNVDINFATATITENPKKSVSMVDIQLTGKTEDIEVPVADIVRFPGFQDLKGREQMMGGLLLLTPLHEKLDGKDVQLTCVKLAGAKGKSVYIVRKIDVAGLKQSASPRFNGQIALLNEASSPISVDRITGFEKEVGGLGALGVGGMQMMLTAPSEIPDEVTIEWSVDNRPQKTVVTLTGIKKAAASGTIRLRFTKDQTWSAQLVP